MAAAAPVIRQQGEGQQLWFAGGGVFTMKATAAETGEAFVLFEDEVVRGKTTPMHLHPHEDESIYVLEGELLINIDGEEARLGTGGVVVFPRGVPHAFMVTSDTARLLCLQTPGTGESFYREASEPLRSADDATRPADIGRLHAVAQASDRIELLGPPPFDLEGAARTAATT